jgi:hypothetical protein
MVTCLGWKESKTVVSEQLTKLVFLFMQRSVCCVHALMWIVKWLHTEVLINFILLLMNIWKVDFSEKRYGIV